MSDACRTDITDQIRGEVREHKIILTRDGKEIGSVPFDPGAVQVDQGYEVDDERIFEVSGNPIPTPEQYVDCDDEAGWC
jgi:hypothetical protein